MSFITTSQAYNTFSLFFHLAVHDYRMELEGIKIRGKNCVRPVKTWAHCGVSKKVLEMLKRFVSVTM